MKYILSFLLPILLVIGPLPVKSQLTSPPKPVEQQYLSGRNFLKNPGFELGKNASYWTASAGSHSISNVYARSGTYSGYWDAGGSGQTFRSNSVTVTDGMAHQPGVGICYIKSNGGALTHKIQAYNGTGVISSETIVGSDTVWGQSQVFFTYGAAASTMALQFEAQANEPGIYIDDCIFGLAQDHVIAKVSQGSLVGTGYWEATAGCDALSNSGAGLDALSDDAGCLGPTVEFNPGPGTIQTTDANNLKFTVNDLPAGYYRVNIRAAWMATSTGGNLAAFAVNDGTTTSGQAAAATTGNGFGSGIGDAVGYFNYTSRGNRTFQLYTSNNSGTLTVYVAGADARAQFSIERFPSTPENIANITAQPASWSGYHDTTCGGWTRSNSSLADPASDASCGFVERTNRNFGTVTALSQLPGITFTPNRSGRFEVCALTRLSTVTAWNELTAALTDGTTNFAHQGSRIYSDGTGGKTPITLCGIVDVASTAAKTIKIYIAATTGQAALTDIGASPAVVEWTIKPLDQGYAVPRLESKVFAKAYCSASVAVADLTAVTHCASATITETDDTHNALSAGEFTVPVGQGGTYQVCASHQYAADDDPDINEAGTMKVYVNGSVLAGGGSIFDHRLDVTAASLLFGGQGCGHFTVSAGAVLTVKIRHGFGGSVSTSTDTENNWISFLKVPN